MNSRRWREPSKFDAIFRWVSGFMTSGVCLIAIQGTSSHLLIVPVIFVVAPLALVLLVLNKCTKSDQTGNNADPNE